MFVRPLIAFVCFGLVAPTGSPLRAGDFVILPAEIQLTHRDSWQTVNVQRALPNERLTTMVTDGVTWSVADESIASWKDDRLVAKKDGTTVLKATITDASGASLVRQAEVTVKLADETTPWEFRNHVEAALSRNGCNMGACHGALAGKGGFRLSLRAYDPSTDYFNITRQDRGRRIELLDPARSILVAKPVGDIEHKGGLRLAKDGHDYRVLTEWIAGGAVDTTALEPKLKSVSVLPEFVQLSKGDSQRFIVLAVYENGRVEDVTHWAKFTSTDEAVASVDEFGSAKVIGPGEGSINVWFASRIASSRIAVPYAKSLEEKAFTNFEVANVIDEKVLEQLRDLGLPPSDACSDHEFLRRAFLCTIGTLPTADEVESFLADVSSDKREKLIDQLLERTEFVDYWAYRWSDVLMLNSSLINAEAVKVYYQWLRKQISQNRPWDQIVREILTAKGESLENGATNFYAVNQDPENMTENACQAFLGLSIGCAKCHNHPLEKWTNDQYYAMANLFARVRAKGWGGDVRAGNADRTLVVLERGDLIQPSTGKPQLPAPLDAAPLDPNDPSDRRIVLADWMVSKSNPYFTRNVVNRIWAAYFGIGIVNSVDDLRGSNPPSNAALMAVLCQHLQDHDYDLKSLMRLILNSSTFQRSSVANEGNQADRKYFSHYFPKRMMAEVLHDAVVQITGLPSEFNKLEMPGADIRDTKFYPEGTRAIQLYDSAVVSQFLKTFGRNQRRITCECERSDEPSIVQVLNINNGDTINDKLAKPGSCVDQWLKELGTDHSQLIRRAFYTTLAREPTEGELTGLASELEAASEDERRVVVEDLVWSLMSSREFLFVF
jgi:hypothetical protein